MLIFVSDLHLVDHASRASFKPAPMFKAIRSRLQEMDTARDPVTLVLLGDIFELLKSHVWFERDVRPWSAPGNDLSAAANEVFSGIVTEPSNACFFVELQALRNEFGVQLQYLPGNHDGLLGDQSVVGLRAALRREVSGLSGIGDEPFDPLLIDEEHGVVAEHGHLLDPFNRLRKKSGRFVPGDAVVIEMLVGLPRRIAELRGADDEFGSDFDFLHEMDNVEPQNLSGLMRWLEFRMDGITGHTKASWEASVSTALRHCINQLRRAMREHHAEPFARKALWTFQLHRLLTRVSFLRTLARLPAASSNEFLQVGRRVSAIAPVVETWDFPPDIYVAGHTHSPLQQVYGTSRGDQMTYLNTGTWRRVQSPVRTLGKVAFREAYHEALAYVHRRSVAAQQGRYELRRYVRGT